jgi:photosystem II stability/assembly factor-like uncharacterized protein
MTSSGFFPLVLAGMAALVWPGAPIPGPTITRQSSGTTARLISVSPVDERIVWASGAGGTFLVTTDGGRTWRAGVVPGADSLQFRDVEGVSAKVAYLLSIGPGPQSRIYKTSDGGQHWSRQFQNQNPKAFYDCFAFWKAGRGIAFSDGADGRFPVIRTEDGNTWQEIGNLLPPPQPREGSFAASGTCVATQGDKNAWIGTGAASKARVLATTDGGKSWTAYDTPIAGDSTSGIASVTFRDALHGVIGGGNVADTVSGQKNVARSDDGGRTWTLATPTPFGGAVYGMAYVPGRRLTLVATGPGGTAWSSDEGKTWSQLTGLSKYWGVAFASGKAGWLVGEGGTILKLGFD